MGPLCINFAFEVETTLGVSNIAWHNQEDKCYPEEEVIDIKKHPVIQEDAGPADEGHDNAH